MGKAAYFIDDETVDHLQNLFGYPPESFKRQVTQIMAEPSPCDNCWRSSYCQAECPRFKKYTNSGKVIPYGKNEHKTVRLLQHH